MIRARLWFKCAAMHDPVTPVIVKPAIIGWDAKERQVELTIERPFKGDELLIRMKGWVTADVRAVIEIVKKHGFLKILDDRLLVTEFETEDNFVNLQEELRNKFKDQVNLERI